MKNYKLILAESSDLDRFLVAAEQAFNESPYSTYFTFNKSRVERMFKQLQDLGKDKAIILLAENDSKIVGILACMLEYSLMGVEDTAIEMSWWVSPEARNSRIAIKMIDAFEYWGTKLGVKRFVLSSMENEHAKSIDKFYLRKKYIKMENSYLKVIV